MTTAAGARRITAPAMTGAPVLDTGERAKGWKLPPAMASQRPRRPAPNRFLEQIREGPRPAFRDLLHRGQSARHPRIRARIGAQLLHGFAAAGRIDLWFRVI